MISILIFCPLCWGFAKNICHFLGDRSWTKNWCKFWILEFWFWGFGNWSFDFGSWSFDFGSWSFDFGSRSFDFGFWSFDFGGLDLGVLILGEPCVPIWCFKTWGWESIFRPLLLRNFEGNDFRPLHFGSIPEFPGSRGSIWGYEIRRSQSQVRTRRWYVRFILGKVTLENLAWYFAQSEKQNALGSTCDNCQFAGRTFQARPHPGRAGRHKWQQHVGLEL